MKNSKSMFQVCVDETVTPAMFGVSCASGERAARLSSDFAEVDRLVRACNRNRLSMAHFRDVIEDFRRS